VQFGVSVLPTRTRVLVIELELGLALFGEGMPCPFGYSIEDVTTPVKGNASRLRNSHGLASAARSCNASAARHDQQIAVVASSGKEPAVEDYEQDYFPGIGSICLEQSRRAPEEERPNCVLPEPPLRPEELNQGYWRDVEDEELCADGDEMEEPLESTSPQETPLGTETRPTEHDAGVLVVTGSKTSEDASALSGPVAIQHTDEANEALAGMCVAHGSDSSTCNGCTAECETSPASRDPVHALDNRRGLGSSQPWNGSNKADWLDCSSITESENSLFTERACQGGICGDLEPRAALECAPDPLSGDRLAESRTRTLPRRAARSPAWRREAPVAMWPPRPASSLQASSKLAATVSESSAPASHWTSTRAGDSPPALGCMAPAGNAATSPVPQMELPRDQRSTAYIRQRKGRPLYYNSYLKLDRLFSCQDPISWRFGDHAHDEMLFITVHQVYELWFKQLIYELDSLRALFLAESMATDGVRAQLRVSVDANRMMNLALHRLDRMVEIQRILVEQIRVLETMTPQEFLTFRDYLFPASGFQSWQYRLLEVKLGVRAEQRISNHWKLHLSEEHQAVLSDAEKEPSLFDLINHWLERLPFVVTTEADFNFWDAYRKATERMLALDRAFIDREIHAGADRARAYRELSRMRNLYRSVYEEQVHQEMVERGQRRMSFKAMAAALLIMLYEREAPYLQLPHRVLRRLLDLDEGMAQWRFRHVQLVSRMIGSKTGTGGSLGVHYLMLTLEASRVFTDLGNMAALLIPARLLPDLPEKLRQQLEYAWTQV